MTHAKKILTNQDDVSPDALTIYFDGQCPLCSMEIDFYKKQQGADALAFVDATQDQAALGDDLAQAQALKRFHVRRADGTLLSGAEAFVAIWRHLPGWRVLARLSDIPGVLWLMERGYRGFLHLRPALSALVGRLRKTTKQDAQ